MPVPNLRRNTLGLTLTPLSHRKLYLRQAGRGRPPRSRGALFTRLPVSGRSVARGRPRSVTCVLTLREGGSAPSESATESVRQTRTCLKRESGTGPQPCKTSPQTRAVVGTPTAPRAEPRAAALTHSVLQGTSGTGPRVALRKDGITSSSVAGAASQNDTAAAPTLRGTRQAQLAGRVPFETSSEITALRLRQALPTPVHP